MGYEQRYALVAMTNGNVYYITKQTAKTLKAIMAEPEKHAASFETVDAKSGSEIAVTIAEISSVVIPKEAHRA